MIVFAVFDPAAAGPRFFTVCVYVMLLPAVTGLGLAEFAMLKSASPATVTAMFTVTELSEVLLSFVVELAVAVSAIIVPPAVGLFTLYTAVIVAVDPGGTLGFVHATGVAFGQVQVPPPVVTTATEVNAVLLGFASLNFAVTQLLGPLLVTVCVYVIVLPCVTGFGVPLLVTVKSQTMVTSVAVVVVLVFTAFVAVTDEVAVIVPAAIVGATFRTTIMSAAVPDATLGSVQLTVPVAPTAGAVQVHPTGAETDANVVLVGVTSVKLAVVAAAGPLLVTVCV
jgi:hypothetical protein